MSPLTNVSGGDQVRRHPRRTHDGYTDKACDPFTVTWPVAVIVLERTDNPAPPSPPRYTAPRPRV
ncbi:hypothetical protein BH23ACT9_BH23ACT9_25450 [soil metagenome]